MLANSSLRVLGTLTLGLTLGPAAAQAAPGDLDAKWQAADRLSCEIAARTRDVPALERCTANLYAVAPRDGKTIELQWALALARGQAKEARELVVRARASTLPADGVARMEDATDALLPGSGRAVERALFIAVWVFSLAAVSFGTARALRRAGPARQASRWWTTT